MANKPANPATAHLKAQKKAEHRRTKAAVLKQRSERLAKRDPTRLEKKIEELRARLGGGGGGGGGGDPSSSSSLPSSSSSRTKDQETLKALERDLALIRRARGGRRGEEDGRRGSGAAAGGTGRARPGARASDNSEDDEDDTDPEVRTIPWPRDTPPPVAPRRRRRRRPSPPSSSSPFSQPTPHHRQVQAPVQVTYSSAPVIRDLRKEATAAKFAPAVVRRNVQLAKGQGALLDEEGWERLEKAGYAGGGGGGGGVGKEERDGADGPEQGRGRAVQVEEVQDEGV